MTPTPPHDDDTVVETVVWRGLTVEIAYKADWLGPNTADSAFATAHLELRSIKPSRAALPVTETGYRSHFLAPGIVEDAGGPVAYVMAWLDHEAKSRRWRDTEAKQNQLDLFE